MQGLASVSQIVLRTHRPCTLEKVRDKSYLSKSNIQRENICIFDDCSGVKYDCSVTHVVGNRIGERQKALTEVEIASVQDFPLVRSYRNPAKCESTLQIHFETSRDYRPIVSFLGQVIGRNGQQQLSFSSSRFSENSALHDVINTFDEMVKPPPVDLAVLPPFVLKPDDYEYRAIKTQHEIAASLIEEWLWTPQS